MLLLTQDFHNTVVQLFTVTHVRAQNFVHPDLLLVDDLLSGPLSSLNLKLLHWSTHPDSKQGLATPPVELLLSNLFYLGRAAKVVTDVVADRRRSPSGLDLLTVGDFWKGPPRPKLTLPPLAPKIESSKEKNLLCTSLLRLVKRSVH